MFDFCCCSVAQLYLTLCSPVDCSMPGFPVLHQLLELVFFFFKKLQNTFQVFMPFYIPTSNVKDFQAILFLVYFLYNLQKYVVHVMYGSVSEFSLFFFFSVDLVGFVDNQYQIFIITEACNNSWNQLALSPSTLVFIFNFFLAILGPLLFCVNFRVRFFLQFFLCKTYWYLIWFVLNL